MNSFDIQIISDLIDKIPSSGISVQIAVEKVLSFNPDSGEFKGLVLGIEGAAYQRGYDLAIAAYQLGRFHGIMYVTNPIVEIGQS